MKLKQLTIQLQGSWQDNAGKYVATLEYDHARGNTVLVLDPELSGKLLAFSAEAINTCARKTAEEAAQSIQGSLLEMSKPEIELGK